MKLTDRIRLMFRSALGDLLGEDFSPASQDDRLQADLDEAAAQIQALWQELAQATVREKRAELDWRAAQSEAEALDAAVTVSLQAGDEAQARARLAALSYQQRHLADLEEHYRLCTQVSQQVQAEAAALQASLEVARRQAQQLAERERSTRELEELEAQGRELRRNAARLAVSLNEREEQLARRADRLAAWKEITRDR